MLRQAVPAVFVLVPLFAGQLLATLPLWPQIAALLLLAALGMILPQAVVRLLWPCLLGTVVATLAKPAPNLTLRNSGSYYALVEAPPTYWAPGAQTVPMTLIAEVQHAREVKTLERVQHVRCTFKHLPWRNGHTLRPGHRLIIRATFHGQTSSGAARCQPLFIGEPAGRETLASVWRSSVRRTLEQVLGPGERSGVLLAMLFGFREAVSVETEEDFRSLGLAHLLVVSGYQVTIVFYCVLSVLRWSARRFEIALRGGVLLWLLPMLALIPTAFFVMIVGIDAPNLRASVALLLVTLLAQSEQFSTRLNVIAATAVMLLLLWPGCYTEPSIQLTFAALLGLSMGALGQRSITKGIVGCSAATILAGAVGAYWFGEWNMMALLANPLIAPIVSCVSCPLALLGMLVHVAGIDPQGLVLQGVSWCLAVLSALVGELAQWPTIRLQAPAAAALAFVVTSMASVVALRRLVRRRGVLMSIHEGGAKTLLW